MEGGKARTSVFFVLIFAVEDNEGKHFHFKSSVYRKSECDLNREGNL